MMFETGSNAELTRKNKRVKVQNDIRTSNYINKQTSPIFNCVTPVSVSLASLAHQFKSYAVVIPKGLTVYSASNLKSGFFKTTVIDPRYSHLTCTYLFFIMENSTFLIHSNTFYAIFVDVKILR